MSSKNNWQLNAIDNTVLDLTLREDLNIPYSDVTTFTLFPESTQNKPVKIISKHKEDIVIAGLPVIHALLEKFDMPFEIKTAYQDGDVLPPNETLLILKSDAKTLLMAERTLLNFISHLCAIATLTKKFVDKVKSTQLKILDTRKTTPGLRHLEKYAVSCGGGANHRMGLYDAFMIKDTHIDLIGDMEKALAHLPNKTENKLPVIVEIRHLKDLETTIKYGKSKVNRVLLDNMSPNLMQQCVKLCRDIFETEASGNINLGNIEAIAESGVDYASIGMLTYGAGQVDLSMIGL